MPKYLLLSLFLAFILTSSPVHALTNAECKALGTDASCDFSCSDGEVNKGTCNDTSVLTGDTCCVPTKVLTETACNSLGGTCKITGCDSTQNQNGMCGAGTVLNNTCCVPKEGGGMSEDQCTKAISNQGRGGECVKASTCTDKKGENAGSCPEAIFGTNTVCCVTEESKAAAEKETGTGTLGNVNVGTKYTPLENVPFINGSTFQSYIEGIYTLALVLIVLSAVFMLVIGGFTYLTSAGNTHAMGSAKEIIYGALFGLVLALVSYIILNTINPDLVNLNVSSFQPLAVREGTAGGDGGVDTGEVDTDNSAGPVKQGGPVSSCKGGLVPIPQGIPHSTSQKICKDMIPKLTELRSKTPGVNWVVSSAVRGWGLSKCHHYNQPITGNCVDIALAPFHSAAWDPLCDQLKTISGLSIANEASSSPKCQQMKSFKIYKTTKGANIHINLTQ